MGAAPAFRHPQGQLLLAGQRKSEISGTRDAEIDADGVLTIPPQRTKNKREHPVPMCKTAQEILRSMPRVRSRKGLLFTTTGDTVMSGFSKAQERFRKRMLELAKAERGEDAEVKHWSWHTLRGSGR